MKKVSLLILVSLILLLSFASCTLLDELLGKAPAECEHEWTEATCAAPKTCTKCNATEGEAAAHDWAAATCTAPKTCKTCNETEGAPNGHTEVTLQAVAPTCTSTGLTEGKKCSVCNTVTKEQTTVAKLAHTEVDVLGTAATCTTTGLTDGKQCSVCQTWTVPQEVIPAGNHALSTIPGTAPTCTEAGLTEGKECLECHEIIVPQEPIPATGHDHKATVTAPTCTEAGFTTYTCACGDTYTDDEVAALGHDTEGAEATKENDHPATCMAPGSYDMVTRCWECGEIASSEHFIIDQLDHKFENYTSNNDATCGVDGTKTAYCAFECGTQSTITDEGSALTHQMPAGTLCDEEWTCEHGCGHKEILEHDYAPATCQTLATCKRPGCGANTGDFAAHIDGEPTTETVTPPTCTEVGIAHKVTNCTVCGTETKRERTDDIPALGHNMLDATCDAPKTCANGCGKTEGEKIANHTIQSTINGNCLTYYCTSCSDSFTTDQLISYTGNDKSDLFFTKNGDPSVSIVDGAYAITAGEQRSQYMIYGPSNDKNHANTMTGWNSTNESFGVFSFRVQPGTITETMRVIIMSSRNNPNWDANKEKLGTADGWGANSLDILGIMPNGDGTFKITGYDITSNVLASVNGTDWVDIKMFIQINAEGILTIGYYINDAFVNTYTYDLLNPEAKKSILNLDINNFYMCGWTAAGTGFAIDDMYFGYQKNSEWLFEEHRHAWADATCEEAKHCTACGLTEGSPLGHTNATKDENIVAPDCVNAGHHEVVTYCSVCNKEFGRETVTDAALGHLEQTVTGTPATCTEAGLSDGKICTREGCKTPTLVAQTPIQATGHKDENTDLVCDNCGTSLDCDHVDTGRTPVAGTPATCTATGLTAGEKCSVCGEFTTAQEVIPALGHTESAAVRENVTLPTCTAAGKYDSVVYCSVCSEMISEEKEVVDPALGHAEVSHEANAPTCTEDGHKAYVTCSRCDYTTFEAVSKTGHSYTAPSCAAAETCTVCGATKGTPNAAAHTLTVALNGSNLTYKCTTCDYNFNVETFDYSDGTNYNGMHANAATNNTVYTTNPDKANYPVMKDGYLEFIRTDAESGAQKQLQLWLPSANGGTNKFSGFTAASNSIGYFSFRVDAKTDVNFEMKLVDHRVDSLNGESIRWGDAWAINDPVFRVMPAADGKTELRGFNGVSLGKFTVDADGFTGWVDVAIQIVLDPITDKVIAHYYINGQYVTTSSRDLTTHTDAIQGVYINFNSKAAGCGYRIDNLTFGYTAHKHNATPSLVNGKLTYTCDCGTEFVVSDEVLNWDGDGSDSGMKNVPNGNVTLDVVDGKYEYIFKPATDTAPDFSAEGNQSQDGWYEYDGKGYAGGQLQMWMPSNNRGESTFTGFSCENDAVGVISFNVKTNLSRHPNWDTSLTFSVGKPRNAADWNDSNGDTINDSWADDSINIFTIEEYQASGVVVKGGLNGTNLNLTTIPVTEDGWSEWFNVMIVIEMTKEEYINVYYYINGKLLGTDSRDLNNPGGYRTLNPKMIEALQISGWTYVPNTGIVFDDFYFGYTKNGHNTYDGHVHNVTEGANCGELTTCSCGWKGYTVDHNFATDCAPMCSDCGLANPHAATHANLAPVATNDGIAYSCSNCGYCYKLDGGMHDMADMVVTNADNSHSYTLTDGTYEVINTGTANGQHQFWIPGQTESAKLAGFTNANNALGFISFKVNTKDTHNTGVEFKINANRGKTDWNGPTNNGWSDSSVGIFKVLGHAADATTVSLTGYNGAALGSIAITGEDGWTGWIDVTIKIQLTADNKISVDYYINGQFLKNITADMVIHTYEINSMYICGRNAGAGEGYKVSDFYFGYTATGAQKSEAPFYNSVLDAANVQSESLKTIVASKIKQCDQTSAPNVEGGTPVYVLADGKDGEEVEALYISRTYEWTTETVHFTEFRFAVNGENKSGPATISFSFDYKIDGTVETNDRYTFKDLEGNSFSADAYVQVKTATDHPLAGDNYPELSGTDLILDGEWHTITYTFDEPLIIIDILLNLYHFQGEMLIANLQVTSA